MNKERTSMERTQLLIGLRGLLQYAEEARPYGNDAARLTTIDFILAEIASVSGAPEEKKSPAPIITHGRVEGEYIGD